MSKVYVLIKAIDLINDIDHEVIGVVTNEKAANEFDNQNWDNAFYHEVKELELDDPELLNRIGGKSERNRT